MELRGKAALVTGGGTGLGRAIALGLARDGADVAVNYSRSEREARETVAELEALGVRAFAVQADVSAPEAVQRLIAEVAERFGGLHVLVNNAGTTKFAAFADLEAIAPEDWDRIMAVNLKGPWLCTRAAAPILRAAGGGTVLNVASIAGLQPSGSSLPYSVSKAGLIHLTRGLALALAPQIRVNAIAPGFMVTRWGMLWTEEARASAAARAALKRHVGIEDAADAALALIRNDSITGQTLVVDAGVVYH